MPPPSLAETLVALLERALVPLPGRTLRLLATAVKGLPVPAERLARVAGYERDRHAQTRAPPRLCVALDAHGVELRPRVWALGSWRLARRIQTPDVEREWHVQAALLAIAVMREYKRSEEELWSLAIAHALQGLGKVEDSSSDALELQLRFALPAIGVGNHTSEQAAAEAALQADSSLSGHELYFGRTSAGLAASAAPPVGLRAALSGERGVSLGQLAVDRAGSVDEALDVLAFLEEWGLHGPAGAKPLDDVAYAQRSGVSVETARARRRRFERLFPGERDPTRLVELLALHAPDAPFMRSLALRVVDRDGDRPAESMAERVTVEREARRDGKWLVSDGHGVHSEHRTRTAAIAAARMLARGTGCELSIYDASGRLRETTVEQAPIDTPEPAFEPSVGADLTYRDPEGHAVIVELKSTNWDALADDQVLRNAQRHVQALHEAAVLQAAAEHVREIVLQYPARPQTPGRAELVERLAARLGCSVVWADERLTADATDPADG